MVGTVLTIAATAAVAVFLLGATIAAFIENGKDDK